jgi:hypothetical protein
MRRKPSGWLVALAPALAWAACGQTKGRERPVAPPAAVAPGAPARLKDAPPERLSVVPPEEPEVDPENKQRRFGHGEAKERREQQKAKAEAAKKPPAGDVIKRSRP